MITFFRRHKLFNVWKFFSKLEGVNLEVCSNDSIPETFVEMMEKLLEINLHFLQENF